MKVENVVTTPFGRAGELAIVRKDSPRVKLLLERGHLREVNDESDAAATTTELEDEADQGSQITSTTSEGDDE